MCSMSRSCERTGCSKLGPDPQRGPRRAPKVSGLVGRPKTQQRTKSTITWPKSPFEWPPTQFFGVPVARYSINLPVFWKKCGGTMAKQDKVQFCPLVAGQMLLHGAIFYSLPADDCTFMLPDATSQISLNIYSNPGSPDHAAIVVR
jgi:hypothetical protein